MAKIDFKKCATLLRQKILFLTLQSKNIAIGLTAVTNASLDLDTRCLVRRRTIK
jgi:hypothetical protein